MGQHCNFLRVVVLGLTLTTAGCQNPSTEQPAAAERVFQIIGNRVVTVQAYVVHTAVQRDENGFPGEVTTTRIEPAFVQGSGIIIGSQEVVTNCHVILAGHEATISTVDGVERRIAGVAMDLERDICLLDVEVQSTAPLPIRTLMSLRVGERVYSVGSPSGLSQSLGEGIVSGLRGEANNQLIQTTAPISPGSSGGGLFDVDGRLVGITTSKLRGTELINFVVPADSIREIRARDAAWRTVSSAAAKRHGEACRNEGARRDFSEQCVYFEATGDLRRGSECRENLERTFPGDALASGLQWSREDPLSNMGWSCLALARSDRGQHDAAVEAIERAVGIRSLPSVLLDASRVFRARGNYRGPELGGADFERALELATKAAKADPRDASAWIELTLGHMARGKLDQALLAAERAASLDARNQLYLDYVSYLRAQTTR